MSRRWATGALVSSVVLLSGCGVFSSDDVTERVQGPLLLTKEQVESQPAGSPSRTVFEWWRALQFDNAVVASRYYAKSLGITPAKLERDLQFGAGVLGLLNRPRLVEVNQTGDRAEVLTLLEFSNENPNGRTDTQQVARAFNMVREDGEWKLAENMFIERRGNLQRALIRETRRQAKAG